MGDAVQLVERFFVSQMNKDGGFKDRRGQSDLYYTIFGIQGLSALQSDFDFEATASYLSSFASGEGLDFVHLTCLARAWAALPHAGPDAHTARELVDKIERFRTADGGYNPTPEAKTGTAYACFLALGAYQDLQVEMPDKNEMLRCLARLKTPDGAFANEVNMKTGLTSSTAAAVAVLSHLGEKADAETAQWLLRQSHPHGGFRAAPTAPYPDLLSTATALHALAGMGVSPAPIKEKCLDFIDSLWVNTGGFYGAWADDRLDCEYTFYGLLALGCLGM